MNATVRKALWETLQQLGYGMLGQLGWAVMAWAAVSVGVVLVAVILAQWQRAKCFAKPVWEEAAAVAWWEHYELVDASRVVRFKDNPNMLVVPAEAQAQQTPATVPNQMEVIL